MEALATKYRPKQFSEVVGQDRSIQILQNQIAAGTTKQGYLFCGSAGTGKTTVARIVAQELKAEVVEIDAASNNGVDNVRELRENIRFKPMGHSSRVYIIDEVHMLSAGAFNALLKTLEEPPGHIVFILCTTDPQKIPATILSRVQRFDFKRVSDIEIAKRLEWIVSEENMSSAVVVGNKPDLSCSPEALTYIAKMACGGMRDAISILDTCLGYSASLTEHDVVDIMGTVDYSVYFNLLNAVCQQDREQIPEIIEGVFSNGKDLKLFVRNFIDFVCDVQKIQLLNNWTFVDIPKTVDTEQLSHKIVTRKADLTPVFHGLCELNKFIQYDTKPKNIIIGWLVRLC